MNKCRLYTLELMFQVNKILILILMIKINDK